MTMPTPPPTSSDVGRSSGKAEDGHDGYWDYLGHVLLIALEEPALKLHPDDPSQVRETLQRWLNNPPEWESLTKAVPRTPAFRALLACRAGVQLRASVAAQDILAAPDQLPSWFAHTRTTRHPAFAVPVSSTDSYLRFGDPEPPPTEEELAALALWTDADRLVAALEIRARMRYPLSARCDRWRLAVVAAWIEMPRRWPSLARPISFLDRAGTRSLAELSYDKAGPDRHLDVREAALEMVMGRIPSG